MQQHEHWYNRCLRLSHPPAVRSVGHSFVPTPELTLCHCLTAKLPAPRTAKTRHPSRSKHWIPTLHRYRRICPGLYDCAPPVDPEREARVASERSALMYQSVQISYIQRRAHADTFTSLAYFRSPFLLSKSLATLQSFIHTILSSAFLSCCSDQRSAIPAGYAQHLPYLPRRER